jgi:2-polyprenyl-3-methyl-5-hydroxy-6-metoxy-1,4-benzoquinol methylase
MLLSEITPTQKQVLEASLMTASGAEISGGDIRDCDRKDHTGPVDAFVQSVIAATGGHMYKQTEGSLARYPVPDLPLPEGGGRRLLDIGCNWGRWCVSAARAGYLPVGLDPNLEAIRAAQRVARQLGVSASFVVGDARFLPFLAGVFDVVFSYSVFQHFEKSDVRLSAGEVSRVLKPLGVCQAQMLNTFGVRNLIVQAKRGFRIPVDFEVRYWTPWELLATFARLVGPASLSVDGFFSANAQQSDRDLLPFRYRLIVDWSARLRRLSTRIQGLRFVADSVYVRATKL